MPKILNPDYLKMSYNTPDIFTNKYPNSDILVIGTGTSTRDILPYKHMINDKFDAVIGVNFAIKHFEDEMTFHLVSEKNPDKLFIYAEDKTSFRKDLPRVFNWKTIPKYPKSMKFIKMTRNDFDGKPNIRQYKTDKTEGMLTGPLGSDKIALGTVILQAMHLAAILGCANLYLIGADYIFKDQDHYYNDKLYSGAKNRNFGTPIIKVNYNGNEYKTLRYFKESAEFIDKAIVNVFQQAGVNVHSFSDGLLQNAQRVNVDNFFDGETDAL